METPILTAFILVIGTIAYFKVKITLKTIKKAKQELTRLERERMQREESFDDCVDYGKV